MESPLVTGEYGDDYDIPRLDNLILGYLSRRASERLPELGVRLNILQESKKGVHLFFEAVSLQKQEDDII